MRGFTMFFLAFTLSVTVFAASIDTKAKAARVYTGKGHVVKCGPKAVGDILLPIQATAALKNGSTLLLMPGNYDGELQITANKVMITGDGSGKKCDVDVKITGRDCIVNNVWIDDIHSNRNLVVVDTVMNRFSSGLDMQKKIKLDQFIFNTCLTGIESGWESTRIVMKNCTLISNWGGSSCPVDCNSNIRLTIINSVLYSPSMLFRFSDWYGRAKSKGKLVLDGCIVFGKSGLGRLGWSDSSRKKQIALNLKELKRLGNVALKRGTKMQMPQFIKQTKFTNGGYTRYGEITPLSYILSPKSPGQGKGVDPKTSPILSIWLKDENMKVLE